MTGHATHTNHNPDAEILALRLVLAIARNDYDAQLAVCNEMSTHQPGDIVRELACTTVDFAKALGGDSDAGAVAVVEQWIQLVLDDIAEESN